MSIRGIVPGLRRYERARRGENEVMLRFMHGMNRLFSNRSVLLERARGIGMMLFNRSGPLRQSVIRRALGV